MFQVRESFSPALRREVVNGITAFKGSHRLSNSGGAGPAESVSVFAVTIQLRCQEATFEIVFACCSYCS